MQIKHFFTPGLAINTFLVFDEKTRKGAIIDPTLQTEVYLATAFDENIQITDILETHVHADFLSGAPALKEALSGRPKIHCSGMGGKSWTPLYADEIVMDKHEIQLGSIRLSAWHTPGHTPEHVIWVGYDGDRNKDIPSVAFTGDLLFVGGVGRPDLLGEVVEKTLIKDLYHSLFEVLKSLPDYVEIFPGHGEGSLCGKEISAKMSSTLGYERVCNPGMVKKEFPSWEKQIMMHMPVAPAYFAKMKALNVKGNNQTTFDLPSILTMKEAEEKIDSCFVIDLHHPEAYATGHIKGSVNIPFTPHFSLWAGMIIPQDKDIILIVSSMAEAIQAIELLRVIGIDRVKGVSDSSLWSHGPHSELVSSPILDIEELYKNLDKYYILDTRPPSEWRTGRIAQAQRIELTELMHSLSNLPKDKPIALVCRSGNRSSSAASLLRNKGYLDATNVKGGMQAWVQANFPVIVEN